MLHLTNGDCAIEPLRAAGVEGGILPWRENLLEGPLRREPGAPPWLWDAGTVRAAR